MIVVETTALGNSTRISKIIEVVEESESRKASVQGRAEHLADSIVPFNFMLAGLIYLVTRNPMRASSALMVDSFAPSACGAPLPSSPRCAYPGAAMLIIYRGALRRRHRRL